MFFVIVERDSRAIILPDSQEIYRNDVEASCSVAAGDSWFTWCAG
jgi:hypothetical protein